MPFVAEKACNTLTGVASRRGGVSESGKFDALAGILEATLLSLPRRSVWMPCFS